FALMIYPAYMTIIGLLMTTAFMNTAALRDCSVKYDQILFATPLSKFGYLGGRFVGALLAALIPALGVYFALFCAGHVGSFVEADQRGPLYLGAYLNSFLLIVLPNTLFIGAIVFALAALFRSSIVSFAGALVLLVGYLITGNIIADLDNEMLAKLLDPFAINTISLETKYWTVDDKNSLWLGFSGAMLFNRLIWICVSLLVFAATYWRFSFARRKERKAKGATQVSTEMKAVSFAKLEALPKVQVMDNAKAALTQLWFQFKIEFWGIAKSTAFIVIMLFGLLNMGTAIQNVDQWLGTGNHPVTYLMVDAIRGSLYLFLSAVIMYYSGVLVWKERDAKMDEFYDASPFPSWVPMLSKFMALVSIVAVVLIGGILLGMITQAMQGYSNFEVGVYVRELLVYDLFSFAFYIMLALFLQAICNNKYLGYLAFLLITIINSYIWSPLEISSNLLILGGTPSYRYSDMNAWGPYTDGLHGFMIYWLAFTALLGVATALYWVRGKAHNWQQRRGIARLRFNRPTAMLSAGFGLVWVLMGSFLFYQTKVVNEIVSSDTREALQVAYENTYGQYEGIAQPRITDIAYEIAIYPEERDFLTQAKVTIVNKHDHPIDSIHLTTPTEFDLTVDFPAAKLVLNDTVLNYQIYELHEPMAAGASLELNLISNYISKGIENEVSNTNIVPNGTFVNNQAFMPVIGYDAGRELAEKGEREEHELVAKSRMPKLHENCSKTCTNTYLSSDADWVNVRTIISTSDDQVAVAPGSLIREWEEEGRRYYEYQLDHKSLNFYSFVSARYVVERDVWVGQDGQKVDVEVYYHPGHEYNVDKMVKSVKHALTYCSENFGPYMHQQARIIEFPRYARFAQAFPGT
ncbi:MAG: ABC transporter permease, partial [Bacteroidota bacterium]